MGGRTAHATTHQEYDDELWMYSMSTGTPSGPGEPMAGGPSTAAEDDNAASVSRKSANRENSSMGTDSEGGIECIGSAASAKSAEVVQMSEVSQADALAFARLRNLGAGTSGNLRRHQCASLRIHVSAIVARDVYCLLY